LKERLMVKAKQDQAGRRNRTGEPSGRRAEVRRVARAAVVAAHMLSSRERHDGLPHQSGTRRFQSRDG
jgi:hypothetical protein